MSNKPAVLVMPHKSYTTAAYIPVQEIKGTNGYSRKLVLSPDYIHMSQPCCGGQRLRADVKEHRYNNGRMETEQAAHIIQHNLRQYTLSKKFQRLRSSNEQRLTQDIPSDRDSVWSDVDVSSHPPSPHLSSASDTSNGYLDTAFIGHNDPSFSPKSQNVSSVSSNGVFETAFLTHSPASKTVAQSLASTSTVVYVDAFSPVKDKFALNPKSARQGCNSPTNDLHAPQRGLYERSRVRRRKYRIGLIMFNNNAEAGLKYLMEQRYLANSAQAVAEFLVGRKGLSRQVIGDYLGNLQKSFNQDVLIWVIRSLKLVGLEIDQGLRQLVALFRFPGESQKIERIVERYSQWFCSCNPSYIKRFNSIDTIFLISFAIMMLNTDLHNPNIKPCNKMTLEGFLKNLRGVDGGKDIPQDILVNIYRRTLSKEFKTDPDHISQVRKVEQSLVGKVPQLISPPRRLVCYCRLYEIADPTKKEKLGLHQREVFLFNDMLIITKIFAKKKDDMTYSFRRSISLNGLVVQSFTTEHYKFGVKLISSQSQTPLICFNARNSHDREKFVDDLIETVTEVKEYRSIQLGTEPKKRSLAERSRMSKDSGVGDLDLSHYGVADAAHTQQLHVRGPAEESRSASLTELQADKGLSKSHSNRSVDSCVMSRNLYHV